MQTFRGRVSLDAAGDGSGRHFRASVAHSFAGAACYLKCRKTWTYYTCVANHVNQGKIMKLKKIRLDLARDKQFPTGSARHGYEIIAPLTAEGHFDLEVWRKTKEKCRIHRFWVGEEDEYGHLMHSRGGWAFHYDLGAGETHDDDVGYRFGSHVFKPGEYVSIQEWDGEMRTYRVTTIQDVDVG